MSALRSLLTDTPFCHRGLHDKSSGRIENSVSAIKAAIELGFGIEIDVQLTSDAQAVVFHDDTLNRLTQETGLVRKRSKDALAQVTLASGPDTVPSLRDVLDLVAGRVPLLIEIKDQDGALGEDIGALEQAVASDLADYTGPVAVMSFNPFSVARLAELLPNIPRGLVTCDFPAQEWKLPEQHARALREIAHFQTANAHFISHDVKDLQRARVQELRRDVPVLCWTVRSEQQAQYALTLADNITFEGFIPA